MYKLPWESSWLNAQLSGIMQNLNTILWVISGIILFVGLIILIRHIQDMVLLSTVTRKNRGTKTERDLVLKLLKFGIPSNFIFHDLYVNKHNGDFSQIDLVVLTNVGIIVFEVKDFSGWIFGNGKYSNWTQVLSYGKEKYRFYNPIMQNNKHIHNLKIHLKQFGNIPFFSIVVFYGDCVLKDVSFIPDGTYIVKSKRILEVMRIITKKNDPAFYADKSQIIKLLKDAVQNGENVETRKRHIEQINDMLGKDRIFD